MVVPFRVFTMATEDVIDLGSSDEETGPAPKKVVPRKNKPNVMVQIPPGVTLKGPSKASSNVNPINKLIGKGLTVTKVNKPSASKLNKPSASKVNKPSVSNKQWCGIPKVNLPLSVRNGKNSRIQIHGQIPRLPVIQNQKPIGPSMRPTFINPLSVAKINNSVHVAGKRLPNLAAPVINMTPKLPSSITLKKMSPNKNTVSCKSSPAKRAAPTKQGNINKKQKIYNVQCSEVMTVDLEDDESPAPSTTGPMWYLRPEEADPIDTSKETRNESDIAAEASTEKKDSDIAAETSATPEKTMQEKNNSEPTKFIEITIEDSPLKPVFNKRTHEVGAELPITIDDSPVKPPTAKHTSSINSDNEDQESENSPKQSKKKLNYPRNSVNTIEIELEPINDEEELVENEDETENKEDKNSDKNKEVEIVIPDNVIEIVESPAKAAPTPPSTPKKDKHARIKPLHIQKEEPAEFHPVYQEFIDLCFKIENSNDMQTIVEKKIKNYYKQVPKEYTESEEFLELVQSKIMAMKAGPEKLYLYIKDVVDELNLQRKIAKANPVVKDTRNIEAEKFQYGEESEFDSKRQRQIRKLEKTLKKLHRAIQKLEEQEVDFDDDEDSVYLLTERYKERMVRVHAKFCQLTNTKMPSEPRILLDPRPGRSAGPAKRLEKWVNKKVPIGTPLPFPDFHDVLRCVREANDEDKLGWNEADIMEEARDLFTRCGKKLQRRRQENEWRLASSRLPLDVDPAESNDDLKKKLENNKQLAAKKETEVFNKYADKQSQLNLEAIEIGDKEAEESPVEEEDDDEVEEVTEISETLGDKERRKDRIRRLLKEKNKNADRDSKRDAPISLEDKAEEVSESKDSKITEIKDDLENHAMEVDAAPEKNTSMEVDETTQNRSKESEQKSSDENKISSDMDELHLLQKLHSDEINTSNVDSSDSESPIDISDTLSSSDNKKPNSDVISIENSSYSESDKNEDMQKIEKMDDSQEPSSSKTVKFDNHYRLAGEIECASSGVKINKTNNDEYNTSVESILLGSSDEEPDDKPKDTSSKSNQCVNLKDDTISIRETAVQKANDDKSVTSEYKVESPLSDAKTINDSPENIESLNADDKQKPEKDKTVYESKVESPLSDVKTIEDSSENTEDSQEVKSPLSDAKTIEDSPENIEIAQAARDTRQDKQIISEGKVESPLSDVKTIEDSSDHTEDSQDARSVEEDNSEKSKLIDKTTVSVANKEDPVNTNDKAESPLNDVKTNEICPENIKVSQESKSVQEDNNYVNEKPKEIISTLDSEESTQDSSKIGTCDIEINGEDRSPLDTNITRIVIESVSSEDSQNPQQAESSPQVIHDTDSNQSSSKSGEKDASDDDTQYGIKETIGKKSEASCRNLHGKENKSNYLSESEDKEIYETKETGTDIAVTTTKDTLEKSEMIISESNSKTTESLESMIEDLQSDLGMDAISATNAVNN